MMLMLGIYITTCESYGYSLMAALTWMTLCLSAVDVPYLILLCHPRLVSLYEAAVSLSVDVVMGSCRSSWLSDIGASSKCQESGVG
jgi:hypothetical protein